ncbi:polysaccharide biosynthesis tyrosine autokinase [Arthrobacter sp. 3Tela_A]|uniref:polysaccharide biosynthesis tyrosine autokinase n=1 Tax=Arthrobacter sp. 3Tela_A TaxID=3093743 RepID=UPI003BB7AE73
MELRDYVRILRRNWILVVAVALLSVLLAALITLVSATKYTSTTKLFVATHSSGSIQELQQGNTFTQARVKSYVETVRTPAVLQPAIDALGLSTTPAELATQIDANADLNTVIITISATSESPTESAAIAQAVADSLIDTVEDLESPSTGGISPVKLSVVAPAIAPPSPSSPNTLLNLTIGLFAGLIVGLGSALIRASLDTKIRGEDDLRTVAEIPLLGGIAYDSAAAADPLLTSAEPRGTRAESFRQIRTNLQFATVGNESGTLLVTSSIPAEGKTTTAINLAIAMAQSGQSVVLIDADLRRPRVDQYLGLERSAGLTTALAGQAEVDSLLQPWGADQLFVLTTGQLPPNPSELLGSLAMKRLLEHLEGAFDVVVIDAPPLLPVTDAAVLSQQVGGVIVVVGSQVVNSKDLSKAMSSLAMVEANILGAVMNKLPTRGPDSYAYSYYSYADAGPDVQRGKAPRNRKSSSVGAGQSRSRQGHTNREPERRRS